MTSEWNHFALGEITELVIDYRGKTPKKLGGDWCKQGYRALSAKNIKTGRIVQAETIRYIDESLYRKWMKDEVQRGDILITSEAPFGQIFFWDSDEKIVLSQRLFCVRIKPEYDARFIYYYMTTPEFQSELDGRATGTTVIGLRQPELMKCIIRCPEIQEQKVIAAILSSIDAKIIANEKVNDNLHQQAATLFKALFVDLTPFDGTMPPNWTISTLGDATEMGAGGDKPKESSPVKTPLCPYPIYSNGINDYGLYGYTNDPKIKVESVTVSARGTIGYVCLRHTPYVPIVRLVTLIPDTKVLSAKYLYLYLRQLHITGTGTTQQQLTVPDFRKTEIIIPDKNTMDSFTETVTPLFEQIWANEDENTKLAEVRDALLPKLMSGEIDVSDIQL